MNRIKIKQKTTKVRIENNGVQNNKELTVEHKITNNVRNKKII